MINSFKKKSFVFFVTQAVLFTVFFQTFFYGNYKIPTGSMMPTLIPGDRLIVNKYIYGYSFYTLPTFLRFESFKSAKKIFVQRYPNRGDIIVFAGIKELGQKDYYTKRIIGIPGDKIKILQGKIHINDQQLNIDFLDIMPARLANNENYFTVAEYKESVLDNKKSYSIFIANEKSEPNNVGTFFVPENSYFVMGDNRDNSLDSRFDYFSYISFDRIIGKIEFVYFSSFEKSTNADVKWSDKIKRSFLFM